MGDLGSIPGLGSSPGEGKGYPPQYSGLKNSMDCGLPGSSTHGIFQARALEWGAITRQTTQQDIYCTSQQTSPITDRGNDTSLDKTQVKANQKQNNVAKRLKRLPPMQETWVRSLGREDPLEKEMAIHSSILAWRIPWTEKPSRLQSMGSQRVRHD